MINYDQTMSYGPGTPGYEASNFRGAQTGNLDLHIRGTKDRPETSSDSDAKLVSTFL